MIAARTREFLCQQYTRARAYILTDNTARPNIGNKKTLCSTADCSTHFAVKQKDWFLLSTQKYPTSNYLDDVCFDEHTHVIFMSTWAVTGNELSCVFDVTMMAETTQSV